MSRVSVDVAVIGGELCGLAAGARAAQAGRRVTVIDDGEVLHKPLGDRLAPIAATAWRLPTTGAAAALFDDLAMRADARRLLGDPVGLGVVDDPDLRCVIPVNADARSRELHRCFGDRADALLRLLEDVDVDARVGVLDELGALHEDGILFEARRARGRVSALGRRADVGAVDDDVNALKGDGYALAPVLTQLGPFLQAQMSGADGLAHHLAAGLLKSGTLLGGAGTGLGPRMVVADLLLSFIKSHGGEIIQDRVSRVDVDGGRIALLATERRKHEVVPRAVVDATAARDLVDRLPSSRGREKLLSLQGRVTTHGGATSVRWLLPASALPQGMPPLALVLDAGSDDAEPTPVLVGLYAGAPLPDATKGAAPAEDGVAVVATAVTKDSTRVEQVLKRLMPFAHTMARATDVVDAAAVAGHYDVKDSEHPLQGRRPRTPYKNLFRAGRDLAPAWGLDGELAASKSVASLIEGVFPKQPKA